MGEVGRFGVRNAIVTTLIGLLGSVVVLAGCGSGGGSTGGEEAQTQSLTKSQFVNRADQICLQGLKEKDEALRETLERIPLKEKEHPSKGTFEILAKDALVPSYKRISQELAALPSPAGDEEEVHSFIVKLKSGVGRAEKNLAAVSRTDFFESAANAAKAYGVEACAF